MKTINYNHQLDLLIPFVKQKFPEFELNEEDKRIYSLVLKYFYSDPQFEQETPFFSLKKGLMIRGNVGVGKTMLMRSILDFFFSTYNIRPFVIKSCTSLNVDFMKNGSETIEKNTWKSFSYSQKKPVSVCFDDLGVEMLNSSHYSNKINLMQMVLLGRYELFIENGMKTFITTNLIGDDIEERYGYRVRSRLREMCNDIPYKGEDRRK